MLFSLISTIGMVIILIGCVVKKWWEGLLGISILCAMNGILATKMLVEGYTAGTISGCSIYGSEIRCLTSYIHLLASAGIEFTKAIFVLLLSIFTWMRKEK